VSFQAQPDRAMPGGMVGLDPRDLPPNVNPSNTGTIGCIVQIGDKFCVLVSNHVHLKQPGPNTVDCALAEIGAEYFDRVNADFPDQIVTSRTSIKPARDM